MIRTDRHAYFELASQVESAGWQNAEAARREEERQELNRAQARAKLSAMKKQRQGFFARLFGG